MGKQGSADKTSREIRRKTRRKFSTEEKIRIVIEGLDEHCDLFDNATVDGSCP